MQCLLPSKNNRPHKSAPRRSTWNFAGRLLHVFLIQFSQGRLHRLSDLASFELQHERFKVGYFSVY